MEILGQIRAVAEARQKAQQAKATYQKLFDEWCGDNAEIIENVAETRGEVNVAEAMLRLMALDIYKETGNKKPAPGVAIRLIKYLDYDPELAIEWAVAAKITQFLKLDKGTFERIALNMPLPFVEIREEPQATIARDLYKVDNAD